MARKKLFALLVSGEKDFFASLKTLLKGQQVEVWSAQSCEEVARLIDQTHPELIFTGTLLSDGTWRDILAMTENALVPTNVIVVGNCKNTRLHLSTMDYGAFDFIIPPFESDPLAHVVRVAADNIRERRGDQSLKAVA
jgi:two-component system, NtrC family, nitrogen regulation response regulator GlnG